MFSAYFPPFPTLYINLYLVWGCSCFFLHLIGPAPPIQGVRWNVSLCCFFYCATWQCRRLYFFIREKITGWCLNGCWFFPNNSLNNWRFSELEAMAWGGVGKVHRSERNRSWDRQVQPGGLPNLLPGIFSACTTACLHPLFVLSVCIKQIKQRQNFLPSKKIKSCPWSFPMLGEVGYVCITVFFLLLHLPPFYKCPLCF